MSHFSYDLFISYSHADKAWVQEWLAPKLKAAGVTLCTDSESFDIGVPALINMERAAAASRHILPVLSPDWVASKWTAYETLLGQSEDPDGALQRTLPLLYRPCTPPPRIRMLTYADLSGAGDTEAEFARLLDAIRGVRRLPDVGERPTAGPGPAPGGRSGGISIGNIQAETVHVAEIMTVHMRRATPVGDASPPEATAAPPLSFSLRQGAGLNVVLSDETASVCRVQLSYTLQVHRPCSLLQLDFSAPAAATVELPDRRQLRLAGQPLAFGPDLRLRSQPTLAAGSYEVFHVKAWRLAVPLRPDVALLLRAETVEPGQMQTCVWATRLRWREDGRVQQEEVTGLDAADATASAVLASLRQQLANRQTLLGKLQQEHILASGRERATLAVLIEQEQAAIVDLQGQIDTFGAYG